MGASRNDLAGKAAAWMQSIEEEGMTESGYIPEHARAYAETIEMDQEKRKATITCRQKVEVCTGGYRMRTSAHTSKRLLTKLCMN